MTRFLTSARLKYFRAEEHVRTLDGEVSKWITLPLDRQGVAIRANLDVKAGRYRCTIQALPEAATGRWGQLIGDIVNNYRSALDHAAWELANADAPSRVSDTSTMFPIARNSADYPGLGALSHMSAVHRSLLEKFQPYQPSNGPEDTFVGGPVSLGLLARLRDWSNADKHRTITPVLLSAPQMTDFHPTDCVISSIAPTSGDPLEGGAEVVSVGIIPTGPNPQMEMRVSPIRQVSLDDKNEWIMTPFWRLGILIIWILEQIEDCQCGPCSRM